MINGDKRTYGKVREISVDQLIRVFRGLAVIEAAVLFGSRTEGGDALPRGRSDYDFAVLLDKRELPSWGPLAAARVAIGKARRILKQFNCPVVPTRSRDPFVMMHEIGLIDDGMYQVLMRAVGGRRVAARGIQRLFANREVSGARGQGSGVTRNPKPGF